VEKQHSLIFLTGFSGSGKSSIGPLLANSLGYDFIDIDSAIEEQEGKTITRIFAEEGERAFRKLEQAMIATIAERKEMVASLGGGALEHTPTFELISTTGTLVYLKSDPKIWQNGFSIKQTALFSGAAAQKNLIGKHWSGTSPQF